MPHVGTDKAAVLTSDLNVIVDPQSDLEVAGHLNVLPQRPVRRLPCPT